MSLQRGSYSIEIPSSTTIDLDLYPSITSASFATGSLSVSSSITTSFVDLNKRADSSSSSGSGSGSASSTKSSSTNGDSCSGDKQKCQKGSYVDAKTVGISVAVPVAVFLLIIGFFMWRSYRKGKKESAEDDDPDFYGETTILPDYPNRGYDEFGNPISGAKGPGGGFDKFNGDNQSYYSMDPFGNNNSARYPAQVMNPPQSARLASERSLNNNSPFYESIPLPYQHNLGSKHSLDEFAKHSLGNEHSGYAISRPSSRTTSRNDSASVYKTQSPHSSTFNMLQQQQKRAAAERALSSEEPTTTESSYSHEKKPDAEDEDQFKTRNNDGDTFKDSATGQAQHLDSQNYHHRQNSDLSYSEDEPEFIFATDRLPEENDQSRNKDQIIVPPTDNHPVDQLKVTNPDEEEEDDEDIKRMKSVYKVYFDRENSVKGKKPEADEEIPSLPNLEDSLPQGQSLNSTIPTLNVEEDFSFDNGAPEKESHEQDEENDPLPTSFGLKVNETAQSRRAASSIYSSIPLPYENAYPSVPEQQQQQQQQQQQYQPSRLPQQYPRQVPYQQQQQQQQGTRPPPPLSRIQIPQYNDPAAPEVPSASRMNYDSIVTNTEYAPTKSLTGGSRPGNFGTKKPFNPIHYSDQIFRPTSPSTPSSPGFDQLNSDGYDFNDVTPPLPHHIRQSIVMVNPVEIGKQKIYRPAGSFSQYQQQSANSSRNGSMTSASVAYSQQEQQEGNDYLPKSGSQADLRKHLGSSNNYSFV
jgi:hypothetical protein